MRFMQSCAGVLMGCVVAMAGSATLALDMGGAREATYVGEGVWKDAGLEGTYAWQAKLSFSGDAEGYQVKDKYFVYLPDGTREGTEDNFYLKLTDNGFFKILNSRDGEKIGYGYCWQIEKDDDDDKDKDDIKRKCHLSGKTDDKEYFEESWTFKDGKLFRMGSMKSESGAIAWRGKFKKR